LWYDAISDEIKKINMKVEKILIMANDKDVNNIVGHKKININKIEEFYGIKCIVKADEKIKEGRFKIITD
jgi:predicted PilT family ATPase